MDKGIRRKIMEALVEGPKTTSDTAAVIGVDRKQAYNALYQSKLSGKVVKKGDLWTIRAGPPVKPKPIKRRQRRAKKNIPEEQHFPLDAVPAKPTKVVKRPPLDTGPLRGATPQQQLAFAVLAILDKILRG